MSRELRYVREGGTLMELTICEKSIGTSPRRTAEGRYRFVAKLIMVGSSREIAFLRLYPSFLSNLGVNRLTCWSETGVIRPKSRRAPRVKDRYVAQRPYPMTPTPAKRAALPTGNASG